MSRLEGNTINNPTNDQEDMMLEIMSLLNDTVTPVPDVGNFYTFVYNPKTPNIQYDHWRKYRNYTWAELVGQLYIVQPDELDDLLAIPYAKFLNN